jgi:hypothetical protein
MKKLFLLASLALLVWGCYPSGPDYVEDLDVVYTTYNDQYDFASKSTYAMPDKIVVDVEIDNGDTTYVFMKDAFATPILAAIDQNMQSKGWTKVDISKKPDLLVSPAAISSTTYYYSYWYDWYYGGWYGGYWGWYYPPYYSVSSYTTGSLIITMADPKGVDDSPIGKSQAAWVAVGNGLYTGAYNTARVTNAINDAFAQSPYLKTN